MLIDIRKVAASRFLRDAASLGGGTALSQLIAIGSLPVLARLYTPEEFGILALYVAIAQVLSVFSTLKLEQMIMLPDSNVDAAGLLVAIFFCSFVFSLTTALIMTLLVVPVLSFMDVDVGFWIYLLPVSFFFSGIYHGLRFWQMRQRNFRLVSVGLVSAITAGTVLSIMVGVWGFGAFGLIIGYIVQGIVNTAVMLYGIRKHKEYFSKLNITRVVRSVSPHKKMMSSLIISHGISSSSMRIPVFAIGGFFGNSVLGFYSLADRIVSAPVQLISDALGDVYRQRASVSWRREGFFFDIYWKTLAVTTFVGVPIFLSAIFVAPELFVIVLGEEWCISGEYAQILLVAALAGFITTPVDKGAVIVGANRFIVWWNLARLGGVVAVVTIAYIFDLEIYTLIWLLVINKVIIYLVNAMYEYGFSLGNKKMV